MENRSWLVVLRAVALAALRAFLAALLRGASLTAALSAALVLVVELLPVVRPLSVSFCNSLPGLSALP